jgi:NADH-quinone oxidoreductase subunit L
MSQENLLNLALLTWLLPLAGFILLVFFNKKLPRSGDWLGVSVLFASLAISCIILYTKLSGFSGAVLQKTFCWVDFGSVPSVGAFRIELGFMLDDVAAIMLAAVGLVSALVHLFSIGYMAGDVRYGRYFAYLGLFTFSMYGIVLSSNLLIMYACWELVGLSSYLLIGHWFEKKSASDAAKKAFIVNRVGDLGMFIGILVLFASFRTFSFDAIFGAIKAGSMPLGSGTWLTAAGILIFCGAVGKSAQFPLHVWLPDAMEGPTPVSALIHAATMVAAGVYLVARTFVIMTADALTVIAYIGAITAFISATIAVTQNDIKKVLAYSTISQLGYMIMGLGVGAYTGGFFHLITHAMFKAGLFLAAGSVIYAMHNAMHGAGDNTADPQDIRNMGGLSSKMPVTSLAFVIYSLAISGIPFTSGFLSKDEILSGALAFGNLTGHWMIPAAGFFAAGLTAFYMFRLVILVFLGEHKDAGRYEAVRESPGVMTIPLVLFAVLSIFIFYSFNPFDASSGWIFKSAARPEGILPAGYAIANPETFEAAMGSVHIVTIILSLVMAGSGIYLAFAVYYWKKIDMQRILSMRPFRYLYTAAYNSYWIDEFYEFVFVGGTKMVARVCRWFDDTVIDGIVNNTATWIVGLARGSRETWEEGKIGSYLYLLVSGALSLFIGVEIWSALTAGNLSVIFGAAAGVFSFCSAGLIFFLFYWGAGGFDIKIIDGFVNLVAYFAGFSGLLMRKLQSGKVQTYLIFALLGAVMLFLWFNERLLN